MVGAIYVLFDSPSLVLRQLLEKKILSQLHSTYHDIFGKVHLINSTFPGLDCLWWCYVERRVSFYISTEQSLSMYKSAWRDILTVSAICLRPVDIDDITCQSLKRTFPTTPRSYVVVGPG